MKDKVKDIWDKINKGYLVLSVLVVCVPGVIWLDKHWDESDALAQCETSLAEKIDSNWFIAMTNKEQWLEMKLIDICARYGKTYPCTVRGMNDSDAAQYEQYKKWLEEQRKKIEGKFGG